MYGPVMSLTFGIRSERHSLAQLFPIKMQLQTSAPLGSQGRQLKRLPRCYRDPILELSYLNFKSLRAKTRFKARKTSTTENMTAACSMLVAILLPTPAHRDLPNSHQYYFRDPLLFRV